MLSIILRINFATEAQKLREQVVNNSVFLYLSGDKIRLT